MRALYTMLLAVMTTSCLTEPAHPNLPTGGGLTPVDTVVLIRDSVRFFVVSREQGPWRWSSSDSTKFVVRQNGLAIARAPGFAYIIATSVTNPGVVLSTAIQDVYPFGIGDPSAQLEVISDAITHLPTDPDSLRGDVEVGFDINALAAAFTTRTAQLLVRRASGDTLIGLWTSAPSTREWRGTFVWSTNARPNGVPAFPNGRYDIAVREADQTGKTVTSSFVSVRVNNP